MNNVLTQQPLGGLQNLFRPHCIVGGGCGGMAPFGGLMGGFSQLLSGLSDALKNLAALIGDDKGGLSPFGSGFFDTGSSSPFGSGIGNPFGPATEPKKIAGTARIWGDPHFIDPDGGKFDVQGEAGKTYNLLSDKGFQMNGRFDKWGSEGATVVGEVGITATGNTISVDKSGKAVVNGQVLKDGQRVGLANGGYVEKNGNDITVKKGEWEVNFQTKGDHINMDIKTDNAIADGVRPHGLIGQTFDGDGKARNGDQGSGTQGGGAIEDAFGNMTKAGDKYAVQSYEVRGLYDNRFYSHNEDFAGLGMGSTSDHVSRLQMMSGFQSLGMSLLSLAGLGFGSFSGMGAFGGSNDWSKPNWL